MQRLYKDTAALMIQDEGQEAPKAVMLPEGTTYETLSHSLDPLGFMWMRIDVQGQQYDLVN